MAEKGAVKTFNVSADHFSFLCGDEGKSKVIQ